jgi:hypothetical protein
MRICPPEPKVKGEGTHGVAVGRGPVLTTKGSPGENVPPPRLRRYSPSELGEKSLMLRPPSPAPGTFPANEGRNCGR